MDNFIPLYSRNDISKLKKKLKTFRIAAGAAALIGLAVCVTLAATVTTANAGRNEIAAFCVSCVCGWAVIALLTFGAIPVKRELGHADMLASAGEREVFEGEVSVTGEKWRIVRSIPFRTVTVGGKSVRVIESKAELLKSAGADRVETANGYVAGYGKEGSR